MSPVRARLIAAAVVGLFAGTTVNALFLQKTTRHFDGPSSAVSIAQFPQDEVHGRVDSRAASNGKSEARQSVAFTPQAQPAVPLYIAIQRELSRKGYANVPSNEAGLRAAILVYEYDAGMNLTGEMKEELLKKLLFDYAPAPRGALADRIETDRKFVTGVQKLLFELGFFSGTLSGQMDSWTIAAVKQFERYRKLPETGRLNEITLLELSRYAGQPLPNDVAGR